LFSVEGKLWLLVVIDQAYPAALPRGHAAVYARGQNDAHLRSTFGVEK